VAQNTNSILDDGPESVLGNGWMIGSARAGATAERHSWGAGNPARLECAYSRVHTESYVYALTMDLHGLSAVIRLKKFSTTIVKRFNDLPITHGSDFDATRKLLKLHQFERSRGNSDGTPRQVLRHPRDFRIMDHPKSSTPKFGKQ
jgi:hypothetical protein